MKLQLVAALAALAASSAAAADMPFGVKLYGINYDRRKNPDWSPSKCKTRDEVWADIDVLSGMAERVRLYGMGDGPCATADVLDAAKGKMKVALGVWPENDSNFANEIRILEDLLRAGKIDDNIDGIHVGSEAIYRENYSADKAIDYLNQVRALMKRYNKGSIKLTIADVVDSYYKNPQLVQAVDEVSINQFSFWERVNVNEATVLMMDRIRSIRRQAANAGKDVLISETGWASAGNEPNASEPSLANQRRFFVDFYQQATAQKLPYFWFAAFDNLWLKDVPKTSEVERYFGVMNMDRSIKSSFANLKSELTPRTQATFKGTSGRFLAETYNPNRIDEVSGVEMIASSTDALTALRYQWFYDAKKGQVRSLNSDRCLDAYEGWNGGRVHTWPCSDDNANQKWSYDATTKQLKHQTHTGLCLDNDANNNYNLALWGCQADNKNQIYDSDIQMPESNAVRLISKQSKDPSTIVQLVRTGDDVAAGVGASGVAGSEWVYDSATNSVRSTLSDNKCLDAYEPKDGGRVHVWACSASEPNQRWSFDSSTGQLRHLTHKGFCLDNDQDGKVIQLWGCHLNNNNQVWRMVSASAKVVKITNSDQSVAEWVSRDQQLLVAAAPKDAQAWFYNSYKNSIVNKWSGECLDADQPYDGGRVHTWDCIPAEGNQKWTFDNGLVKHATHKGLCLAYKNAAEKSLVLKTCSSSDSSQSFTLPLASAQSAASPGTVHA